MQSKKQYDCTAIEQKWQAYWQKNHTFKVHNQSEKPPFYILDMFPYPSGQGLHTGHALGYIASDIFSRYKKSLGYNVLHPMGFDSFGLPAEQYAQQIGEHPRITTKSNTDRYRIQLKSLGISFDWDREVSTSQSDYYHWTQWLFLLLFNSWYDQSSQQASPIENLIKTLSQEGNSHLQAACNQETPSITAHQWQTMSEQDQQTFLLNYRLAYLDESIVNWCPSLGTVLANDEVKEGLSERGGYPVIKKKMKQWSLRITAYADRLLTNLDTLNWSISLKEIQRNWIGRSEGARIDLQVDHSDIEGVIPIFSTLPETIFGATFLTLAPAHPYIKTFISLQKNGTPIQQKRAQALLQYQEESAHLSERQRMQNAEKISGAFTGFYAKNPLTKEKIPIWVGQYVLETYGTGAVMGVPAHDTRDEAFAKHFSIPIIPVIKTTKEKKGGYMINSSFLNGMDVQTARRHIIQTLVQQDIGYPQTQYRLRDAVFSRQRYWGEPFPIYYKDGTPYPMEAKDLPLLLPELNDYKSTSDGNPPLSKAANWHTPEGNPIEDNTMPGWAGSSWYFFRYMDPRNSKTFASKEATDYWKNVNLYIGGAEHATGHLLYARFFTKVLHDLGYVTTDEPFQTLINQGMIQATTHFVYRIKGTNQFVTHNKKEHYDTTPLRVDHTLVKKKVLDLNEFKKWRSDFNNATFILENNQYICGEAIEKMSKSKHNAINPDEIIAQYGADTFRLYIMFLGPITQSKPWNTEGIQGIQRFIQKVWKLFHPDFSPLTEAPPSQEAQCAIHTAIKEVKESIERYAFNTAVSSLMISVNTLLKQKCTSKIVCEQLIQLLAPFAPHLAEEIWQQLGHQESILQSAFPDYDPLKLVTLQTTYPIAINGKTRTEISLPTKSTPSEIKEKIQTYSPIQKWLDKKKIKKIIVIPHKMINILLA